MTCWSLRFSGYARHSLDHLQEAHTRAQRVLEKLGGPIDVTVYQQLCDAGEGHDWLFGGGEWALSISISISDTGEASVSPDDQRPPSAEAGPVFVALRSIMDEHRQRWLAECLDQMLDSMWRTDLGAAAGAYWKRFRGKGGARPSSRRCPMCGSRLGAGSAQTTARLHALWACKALFLSPQRRPIAVCPLIAPRYTVRSAGSLLSRPVLTTGPAGGHTPPWSARVAK